MNIVPCRNTAAVVAATILATAGGSFSVNQARAADEYATLNLFNGHVGSIIQVSGGKFLPNETLSIYGGQHLGTISTVSHADGSFGPVAYTIPASTFGALPITVTGGSETASNSFYVQPFLPSITLSASSVVPFSSVGVSGSGFMPGETVNVILASASVSTIADVNGSFKGLSVAVPNIAAGTQKVVATGTTSSASATSYEYVNGFYASVSPSAAYLIPGQTLSFNGSGFAPSEPIDIMVTTNGSSQKVATFSAALDGSFKNAGSIVIAANQAGKTLSYQITGETSSAGGSLSVSIGTLNPLISLSGYYLVPGSVYSVSVSGYLAGENINLSQSGSTVATIKADATGSGTFLELVFPVTSSTSLTYVATGETSAASASASVTAGQYHPYASVSNSYATPGTALTVSGGGFGPGEKVSLAVGGVANVASAVTDKLGNIKNVAITMPSASDQSGMSSIVVNGQYGETPISIVLTVAPFLTQLAPSNYYVAPGSSFNLNGTGYAPGEQVAISQGINALGSIAANKTGAFAFPVILPFGVMNINYIATGAMSKTPATAAIGVAAFNPNITLGSYSGTADQMVSITGTGFAPNEGISLTYDGGAPWTVKADQKGNLSAGVGIPFGKSGPKVIAATGVLSVATSSATFGLMAFMANIELGSYFGTADQMVSITGTGFAPNEGISLTYDGGAPWTVKADQKGSLSAGVGIPFGKSGPKVIAATGVLSNVSSSATFSLAGFAPTLGLSAYYGAGGQFNFITGTGFAPNEGISLTYDGGAPWTVKADQKGNLSAGVGIPFGKTGEKIVTATGLLSNATANATFTLAAFSGNITLSSYYGAGGASNTVSGNGYAPNEVISVTYNGVPLNAGTADKKGSFSITIIVPFGKAGDGVVTVSGATSKGSSSATFTIAPVYVMLQLGTYAGAPGTAVIMKGSGYLPGEKIDVSTDRTTGVIYSLFADSNGSFSDSGYLIPKDSIKGNLSFTVVGEHSMTEVSIAYYVMGS